MSQAAANPLGPSDPTTITTDIPCRRCAYNLRGLTTDARCPECGIAIAASISGDFLRYCDPLWVTLLARGMKLILIGITAMIFGAIANIVFFFVLTGPGPVIPGALASLAGNVLIVIGSWLVTTPDPSGIGEDKYGTARKIIRITLLIGIGNTLFNLAGEWTLLPPPTARVIRVIGEFAGIIGIIGLVAQLHYFEKLAQRIPDPPLSSRAKFLKKMLPGFYLALIVVGIFGVVFVRNSRSSRDAILALGCFMGIIGIGLLMLGIMYLLMIDMFRRRFKEEALVAAQNWAAHATAPGGAIRPENVPATD